MNIPYLLKCGKTEIMTVAQAKQDIDARRQRCLLNRLIYQRNQEKQYWVRINEKKKRYRLQTREIKHQEKV